MDEFLDALTHFLQRWGQLDLVSTLVVGAIIIVFSLLPMPRTTVNIAIGAIFGFWSIPVIVVCNAIGAAFAFLIARYLLFERLQRFATSKPTLSALLKAVDDEGWRFVALVRLGGGVPGVLQNYLYGLTGIPLATCTLMTLIFAIPQIWVHVYLGVAGRAVLEERTASIDLLVAAGTIVVVTCVIVLIGRKMRAALRAELRC